MKKALTIVLTLFILFISSGCSSFYVKTHMSNVLGIELPKDVRIAIQDTHSGFHGDGVKTVSVYIPDENSNAFTQQIYSNENFKVLPLSDELNGLLYTSDNAEFNFAADNQIPKVENGAYFFLDRFDEDISQSKLLERGAFNFTYAVYDKDSSILYYMEADT